MAFVAATGSITFATPGPNTTLDTGAIVIQATETSAALADAGENTSAFEARKWDEVTFICENDDATRTVVFQAQGSKTSAFTEVYNIGSTLSVTTESNDFMTLENTHPFVRVNANPTGGACTAAVRVTAVGRKSGAM